MMFGDSSAPDDSTAANRFVSQTVQGRAIGILKMPMCPCAHVPIRRYCIGRNPTDIICSGPANLRRKSCIAELER